MAVAVDRAATVDRGTTVPSLLRVFVSEDGLHHQARAYRGAASNNLPRGEHHVYGWSDTTLREIADECAFPSNGRARA